MGTDTEGPDEAMIAYLVPGASDDDGFSAAPVGRAWMEASPQRFANRCLPLLLANQAGWLLYNPVRVTLCWDGGAGTSAVTIEHGSEAAPPVASHFGQGIVTWTTPFLFRTSPGVDLLVRGPSNCPKDGIYALDGLVETDWTPATFTMNWQLTRPNLPVVFDGGEPYAMVVPQPRGALERYAPIVRPLEDDPQLLAEHAQWAVSRTRFNADLRSGEHEGLGWQRDYFQGRHTPVSTRHQTRLKLRQPVVLDGDDAARHPNA